MKKQSKICWPLAIIGAAAFILFAISVAFSDEADDGEGVCIISDAAICDAINTTLMADKYVPAHLIEARVRRGIVILEGEARNPLGKAHAIARVKNLNGVRGVIDNIAMAPPVMSDEDLHRRVFSTLANDPALDMEQIKIDAYRGYVRIYGITDSWARRRIAQLDAESVVGVRAVVNDMYVKYDPERSDRQIAIEICRLLEMDPLVDASLLEMFVKDRLAIFSGTTSSEFQRFYIARLVRAAGAYDADMQDVTVVCPKRRVFRTEPPRLSDEDLLQAVNETLIFDKRVQKEKISVCLENGVVSLTGEAASPEARIAAESDALNTIGVNAVKNSISISKNYSPTDADIDIAANRLIRQSTRVDTIRAYVSNGEVTLVGTVPTGLEKLVAMHRAAAVPGVVRVDNRIYTGGDYGWRRDKQIERDMKNSILHSPYIRSADVNVKVTNGLAVVSGTVDDFIARRHVEDIADQSGARFLKNILRVRECGQE